MDSSGSITDPDYKKEKDFVKKAARRLGISQLSRAAIVLYSTNAHVEARFGQFDNVRDFERAVDSLRYLNSTTRIDRALALATRDVFPEARLNVTKILVVLTDGKQTQSQNARVIGLREASDPLRMQGVHIIAVGVAEAERAELRLMTDSEEDVLMSKNFDELNQKLQKLVQAVCGKKITQRYVFVFFDGSLQFRQSLQNTL